MRMRHARVKVLCYSHISSIMIMASSCMGGELFTKSMPEGTVLSLKKHSRVEVRNEPKGGRAIDMATNAVFLPGRYVIDTYSVNLEKDGRNETILEKDVTHLERMKLPEFSIFDVLDAEIDTDTVGLLLSVQGVVTLQTQAKNRDGKWQTVSSEVIKKGVIGGVSGRIVRHGREKAVVVSSRSGDQEQFTTTNTASGRVWTSDSSMR